MFISRRLGWPVLAIAFFQGLAVVAVSPQMSVASDHGLSAPSSVVGLADRDQAQALFYQGVQKALQEDYGEAVQYYNQALSLNPNNPDVYYNRGVAHFSLGGLQTALQDFDQTIQLQPNRAAAYGNRGAVRSALGDRQGAISDCQQAIKLFKAQGDPAAAQQMQAWLQEQVSSSVDLGSNSAATPE